MGALNIEDVDIKTMIAVQNIKVDLIIKNMAQLASMISIAHGVSSGANEKSSRDFQKHTDRFNSNFDEANNLLIEIEREHRTVPENG